MEDIFYFLKLLDENNICQSSEDVTDILPKSLNLSYIPTYVNEWQKFLPIIPQFDRDFTYHLEITYISIRQINMKLTSLQIISSNNGDFNIITI